MELRLPKITMHGGTRLRLQKLNYARRNTNTTPKIKLCVEVCNYNTRRLTVLGGMQLQLQKINCAWSNAITTPEAKLCTEEREYDPKR